MSHRFDCAACNPQIRRLVDVDVVAASRREATTIIQNAIESKSGSIFGFCNAHTVNTARKNGKFRESLEKITIFNDGVGVDVASRFLFGEPFPVNLNGTDFLPHLLASLRKPVNVFLLGSRSAVVETAAARLEAHFPNARIVGCHSGFFDEADSLGIASQIMSKKTDLLLIGMGHPRQEIWAANWATSTGAVSICVGAFLDFAAGAVRRAPPAVRNLRLEWLYRLANEPSRLSKRYLVGNLSFLFAVFAARFSSSRK